MSSDLEGGIVAATGPSGGETSDSDSELEDSVIDIVGSTVRWDKWDIIRIEEKNKPSEAFLTANPPLPQPQELQMLIDSLRSEVASLKKQLSHRDKELEEARSPPPSPNPAPPPAATKPHKKAKRRCLCEYRPITYFKKYKGETFYKFYPLPHWSVLITVFISAFIGIAVVGLLHFYVFQPINKVAWMGSLGAVATLLYGVPTSPLAQPRNVIAGNFLSGAIGVGFHQIFANHPDLYWLAGAFAVSLSIVIMHLFKCVHPPGGATALIAVLGPDPVFSEGWWFLLTPVLVATVTMTLVSLIVTNFARKLRYPINWV